MEFVLLSLDEILRLGSSAGVRAEDVCDASTMCEVASRSRIVAVKTSFLSTELDSEFSSGTCFVAVVFASGVVLLSSEVKTWFNQLKIELWRN